MHGKMKNKPEIIIKKGKAMAQKNMQQAFELVHDTPPAITFNFHCCIFIVTFKVAGSHSL